MTIDGEMRVKRQVPLELQMPGTQYLGTKDHNKLFNRDMPNQHPIDAITKLRETLQKIEFDSLRINKLDDYFYTAEFQNYDYADGAAYYAQYKPLIGACSAVINGNLIGRNYDWYYGTKCSFEVFTPAANGRHRVVGTATAPKAITQELIASGEWNDFYRVIPFMLLDGKNDAGLFCEINVVTPDSKGITTGTHPDKEDLFAAMIPRYVLDYAGSVDEAIALLDNRNVFCADSESLKEEFHFLLKDSEKTVCIEFVGNEMVVIDQFVDDKPISTNFYLDGYNGTRESLTLYAMGIERYAILSDGFDAAVSKEDMIALMQSVLYTKAYSTEETPTWYSEFFGVTERFGDLNKNSPPEAFDGILAYARDLFANRSRETGLTWHTVHTAVYDDAAKTVTIIPQESGHRFFFSTAGHEGGQSNDHNDLTGRNKPNQHPMEAISGLNEALENKQPKGNYATEEQLSGVSQEVERLGGEVTDIEKLIPNQASEQNQLADKDFVNSTVATNTATFRGSYNVVTDLHLTLDATDAQIATALMSIVGVQTNNDYVYVYFVNATTGVTEKYERFKYAADTAVWAYEFTLNNSSFTAAQWAAINSGITSLLVATITENQTAIAEIEASLADYAKIADLPTKVSDLTNDTGFITEKALSPYRTADEQDEIDNKKVNEIIGKGLSTNDYTNEDKEIVSAFSIVDGKLNITYEE